MTDERLNIFLLAASTFMLRSALASRAILFSSCLRLNSEKFLEIQAAQIIAAEPNESINRIHEISANTVRPNRKSASKITLAPV